jgi:hypothetical protein
MSNRFKDFGAGVSGNGTKIGKIDAHPGALSSDVGSRRLGSFVYCADVAPGTEVLFWGLVSMPIEFLHGRPLSPEELEMLRRQIEEGFDNTADVDDEIRAIVARNWPYLLEKLPPEGE